MINPESYPIIVLGVERSGTSVVAEMLHRNAKFGQRDSPIQAEEGRGFYESRGFRLETVLKDFYSDGDAVMYSRILKF